MGTIEQPLVTRSTGGWDVLIPLPPVPASRPRVSKWGTYYLKTYATWKREASRLLLPYRVLDLFPGPILCSVSSVVKRPKKLTKEFPHPDVDNFAKAALDAITEAEIVWVDDTQVIKLITQKRYAEVGEEPHTFVHIEER